jgi:DNA repair exonuclease SbcCD ATPase subunit
MAMVGKVVVGLESHATAFSSGIVQGQAALTGLSGTARVSVRQMESLNTTLEALSKGGGPMAEFAARSLTGLRDFDSAANQSAAEVSQLTRSLQSLAKSGGPAAEYARKALQDMSGEATAATTRVGGLRGVLESLRSGAGRGSTLDQLARTMRGAGALAGISMLGTAIAHTAEEAAKLSEAFDKGQISAMGVGVKLGESLPVIGGFVTAGQSIREMFTHEQEQIDAINKSIELGNGIMEARVKLTRQVAEEAAGWKRQADEAMAKVAEAGMRPQDRAAFRINFELGEKQDDLKRKVEEQLRGVDEAVAEQHAKLAGEMQSLRAELEHATPGTENYKALSTTLAGLAQNMDGLASQARKQKAELEAAARATASALDQEAAAARAAPMAEYFEKLQEKLDDLNPDPLGKVRAEVDRLHGSAADAATAIETMQKIEAAEQFKKDAEELKSWGTELDETAAKIKALQGGASEKAAEMAAKFAGAADSQKAIVATLQKRQEMEDAQIKALENQKKLTEEMAQLKADSATAGLTAAQKRLGELAEHGASASMLAQARAWTEQADRMESAKKEQEDAAKLVEKSLTPIERYREEMGKILKMQADGFLTAKQAAEGIRKAKEDLAKEDKDGGAAKESKAVTRRFDFTVPARPQVASAQDRANALLQQHLEQGRMLTNYMKPVYDFYNDPANATPDQIVGI